MGDSAGKFRNRLGDHWLHFVSLQSGRFELGPDESTQHGRHVSNV
jgi:hypothetical protein